MNILGTKQKFKVDRETNLGYTLIYNDEEYFLHHNECNGRRLNTGSFVEAFIYADKKNRLAATLLNPTVTVNQIGFGRVVDINRELGVFVNIGISKDILFSKDELPFNFKLWPQVDDVLIVEMKVKQNRLILKMANKLQIERKRQTGEEIEIPVNTKVDAYVYRITDDGINLVTDDYNVIFVYKTNYRKNYRLGEKTTVTVQKKNTDDYAGTMIEQKEFQIVDDKKTILEYLKGNNGVMMITENSSPELIVSALHMSKSAFKKAIGGLLKSEEIIIMDDKIVLNDFNDF